MKLLDWIPNKTIVNCDRDPYLKRWYLFRTKPFAVFLHRFFRSDEDRALHDHPWPFITFILWRGYIEHQQVLYDCHHCGGGGYRLSSIEFNYPIRCEYCKGSGKIEHLKTFRRWPLTIHYRPATHRHRVELIDGKPAWTIVVRLKECREWGFWPNGVFMAWNKWWQNNCE